MAEKEKEKSKLVKRPVTTEVQEKLSGCKNWIRKKVMVDPQEGYGGFLRARRRRHPDEQALRIVQRRGQDLRAGER
eukprot:3741776-Pyramimonas_sp.AAC.1